MTGDTSDREAQLEVDPRGTMSVPRLLPGSLGVLAARRGQVILVWVISALFIALWVVWWRHFLILSAMPVLYLGTAVLTTVASQAKERR